MKNPQQEKFPAHRDIEMRAYEIYLARGAEEGHALEHWLIAEEELLQRRVVPSTAAAGNRNIREEGSSSRSETAEKQRNRTKSG